MPFGFPELLYRLRASDRGSALIKPVRRSQTFAAANATLPILLAVTERDRVTVLTSVGITLAPGAAQFALGCVVQTADVPMTNPVAFIGRHENPALGATISARYDWSGSLFIPFGYTVNATGFFNAGAAVNTLFFDVTGFSIPRGSIENP